LSYYSKININEINNIIKQNKIDIEWITNSLFIDKTFVENLLNKNIQLFECHNKNFINKVIYKLFGEDEDSDINR
jgi:predicted XRE-type DNA-binding protein